MAKVEDLFGKFKSEEEKNAFIEAQFQTITQLTKQVEQLKAEKKHVEELLKTATPTVFKEEDISDEEKVCRVQLRVLEGISRDRELTLEESRKVDTYAKLLMQLKNSNKKVSSPVDNMPVADLLQLVKDENKNS